MKNIIFLLILNFSLLFGQNSDPIQQSFSYGADTITKFLINSNHQLFKQTNNIYSICIMAVTLVKGLLEI